MDDGPVVLLIGLCGNATKALHENSKEWRKLFEQSVVQFKELAEITERLFEHCEFLLEEVADLKSK